MALKIMIVEDEVMCAAMCKVMLEKKGFSAVTVSHSKADALKIYPHVLPDVIFMDVNMEYPTAGIDACREIKALSPSVKIYFTSAYSAESLKNELSGVLYDGFIDKLEFPKKFPALLSA